MKRKLLKPSLLLLLLCCSFLSGNAQFGAWNYQVPVTATNPTGVAQMDYQIRMVVNTALPISQGKMEADGKDIRFGDPCGVQNYAYWIEDYINTDTTVIWVKLDSIALGGSLSFFMYYGNTAATAVSSFGATFPNAIQTTGSVTLTAGQTVDWLEVNAGDTLFLVSGAVNNLNARYVDVQGVIMGNGRGHQAPATSNTGNGPGGGNWGSSSGAGGGSYGGAGGIGGYDSSDPINQPGPVYGTTTGPDIDMGSTGGSASTVIAGPGGAGLMLTAEYLTIAGQILCNAGPAQQPGGGQGAGGGSGGGILLHGENVTFSGALSANGLGGSIGTSTANDDGGGGGGGRIKIFYDAAIANSGTMTVTGGPGGVNGGAGQGAPGSAGTTHMDTLAFEVVTGSLGSEAINSAPPAPVITAPTVACDGDSVMIMVSGPYTNFTFASGGTTLQSGLDSTYVYAASSTQMIQVTSVGACTYVDSLTISVNPTPVTSIIPPTGQLCDGTGAVLSILAGYPSVTWSTGATGNAATVSSSGTYSVQVTDSAGCVGGDTITLTFAPSPSPVITTNTGGTSFCDGETAVLTVASTLPSIMWSTGDTTNSISLTTSATIFVTSTDTGGCSGSDTIAITVNPNPVPVITNTSGVLGTTVAFSTYQWMLNGGNITGATNPTYTATTSGTYSVAVTDANGCSGASDTTFVMVSMESALAHSEVGLQPNPFNTHFQISANIPVAGELELNLVNVNGQVVFTQKETVSAGAWRTDLNLSDLPAGMYFLQIQSKDAFSTHRVVKQ